MEHNKIVNDWRAHFGRLPTSLLGERPDPSVHPDGVGQAELRDAYGIADNEADDWDNDDSDDGIEASTVETSASTASPQPPASDTAAQPRAIKVGLRPGGRAKR